METVQQAALELSQGLEPTASNIERVSKKTSPEAARWAFGQWEDRKKASAKGFPAAEEMLFSVGALEQATHFSIARYHASLFPAGVLVADLTCGLGSDLIALAERGPVIGYDIDERRVECARHNLAVHGFEGDIVLGDCLEENWNFEYAIADPSRREFHSNGFRHWNLDKYEPNPRSLGILMNARLRFGIMKLSPILSDDVLLAFGTRVDFVSFGRQCRESLAYLGSENGGSRDRIAKLPHQGWQDTSWRLPVDLAVGNSEPANSGRIFAVKIEASECIPRSDPAPEVEEPLGYLYESDPAAIRAHSLGYLANKFSLIGLGDSNGYLTSDSMVSSPWLVGYRVSEFGRFDTKHLRARLAKLGGGRPIVKSRVPSIDVVKTGKDLTTKGVGSPIVAIYPVGPSLRYVILERIYVHNVPSAGHPPLAPPSREGKLPDVSK